jgi:antimicrobial peptide system SdpB family protein
MLTAATQRLTRALSDYQPWTNVYGAARSVIALATACTLAFNDGGTLLPSATREHSTLVCDGLRRASALCIAPHHLDVVRWLSVAVLLVVASGFRPRWTALPHWWVAVSFQASVTTIDGGDQVAAVLAFLMLPIALTDDRAWPWQAPVARPLSEAESCRRLVAWFGHALVRLQVAGIYFHAFVGKVTVPEWKDGTATYYWFTHEAFGAPRWLAPLLHPILVSGVGVTAVTWSVIVLEMLLAVAMFMTRRAQRALMFAGMTMHFGIVFVHGLPTFGATMIAALLVYLRPLGSPLRSDRGRRGSSHTPASRSRTPRPPRAPSWGSDATAANHRVKRAGTTPKKERLGQDCPPGNGHRCPREPRPPAPLRAIFSTNRRLWGFLPS